jgi:hypothetical protein
VNLYRYVGNGPTQKTDRNGMDGDPQRELKNLANVIAAIQTRAKLAWDGQGLNGQKVGDFYPTKQADLARLAELDAIIKYALKNGLYNEDFLKGIQDEILQIETRISDAEAAAKAAINKELDAIARRGRLADLQLRDAIKNLQDIDKDLVRIAKQWASWGVDNVPLWSFAKGLDQLLSGRDSITGEPIGAKGYLTSLLQVLGGLLDFIAAAKSGGTQRISAAELKTAEAIADKLGLEALDLMSRGNLPSDFVFKPAQMKILLRNIESFARIKGVRIEVIWGRKGQRILDEIERDAAFARPQGGQPAQLILGKNPTYYQFIHEWLHFLHYLEEADYANLPQVLKDQLTREEQEDAINYMAGHLWEGMSEINRSKVEEITRAIQNAEARMKPRY